MSASATAEAAANAKKSLRCIFITVHHTLRELGDEALAPIETPEREEVVIAAAA
jgi:hypothetical protein